MEIKWYWYVIIGIVVIFGMMYVAKEVAIQEKKTIQEMYQPKFVKTLQAKSDNASFVVFNVTPIFGFEQRAEFIPKTQKETSGFEAWKILKDSIKYHASEEGKEEYKKEALVPFVIGGCKKWPTAIAYPLNPAEINNIDELNKTLEDLARQWQEWEKGVKTDMSLQIENAQLPYVEFTKDSLDVFPRPVYYGVCLPDLQPLDLFCWIDAKQYVQTHQHKARCILRKGIARGWGLDFDMQRMNALFVPGHKSQEILGRFSLTSEDIFALLKVEIIFGHLEAVGKILEGCVGKEFDPKLTLLGLPLFIDATEKKPASDSDETWTYALSDGSTKKPAFRIYFKDKKVVKWEELE